MCNYLETNKMMTSIGLGWTILPETMLDGSVKKIAIRDISLRRELGYVTHIDMTLSNATRAMIIAIVYFTILLILCLYYHFLRSFGVFLIASSTAFNDNTT